MKKKLGTMLIVGALLGGLSAGPVVAASASRPGSYSWTTETQVRNKDTAADSNFTAVPYVLRQGGEGSLVNRSGHGAVVERTADAVAVKACVSRPLLPMACTDWNSNE